MFFVINETGLSRLSRLFCVVEHIDLLSRVGSGSGFEGRRGDGGGGRG